MAKQSSRLIDLIEAIETGKPAPSENPNRDQQFQEVIGQYSEYRQHFNSQMTMRELSERLAKMAEFAEQTVMSEADDWFDGATIKRNMKELKAYVNEFSKVAQEHDSSRTRMAALFDDFGRVLGRYFEMGGNMDNLVSPGQEERGYDTDGDGDDDLVAGNSGKSPVAPGQQTRMAHETQTSASMGVLPTDQGDDIHHIDDNADEADWRHVPDREEYSHERDDDAREMDETEFASEPNRTDIKFDYNNDDAREAGQGWDEPDARGDSGWMTDDNYNDDTYRKDIARHSMDEDETPADNGAGLERAKDLTQRIVALAREQLKGEQLIRFDTLPREIQIKAAWRLIR